MCRKFKKGTFLALALEVNNGDFAKMKQVLEEEYYRTSTKEMANRWGFDPRTIYRSLVKIGIPPRPKGWAGTRSGFQRVVDARGGLEAVMKKFNKLKPKDLGLELGFSADYISRKLKKLGYFWDDEKGRWVKVKCTT